MLIKPKQVFVLHWFPLEMYPPVMNLLNSLACSGHYDVVVCSTRSYKTLSDYGNPDISISRTRFPDPCTSRVKRCISFVNFVILAAWRVLWFRPHVVLYFEPHSSFPAFLCRILGLRHRLFVHYHEYYAPDHFSVPGMKLIACYHWFERRWLYQYAEWISQTNERRLELFHADHPSIDPAKLRVMGNFPPAIWRKESLVARGKLLVARDKLREASGELLERPSLRLVYVGSVSLHDTFIGPLVDWILSRKDDAVTLDVFAYNADEKTKDFLREASDERREAVGWREKASDFRLQTSGARLQAADLELSSPDSGLQTPISGLTPPASRLKPAPRVRYFEQGVDYDRLPEVLANYDVGVILYRCNTTNYKFNASNKLFEYLACGLEVWYPPQMLGVKPYARTDAFPRVMEVDFEKLDTVDLEVMRDTQGLPPAPPPPCCEDEFEKLLEAMRGS